MKTLAQQSIQSFKSMAHNEGVVMPVHKEQKTLGRNQSQNFFKTSNTNHTIQSFLLSSSSDLQNELKKSSLAPDLHLKYLDTEEIQSSPVALAKQISADGYTQSTNNTSRPHTVITNNFHVSAGINQYISNVPVLGKPPSNGQKGFLSHNSSAKNLKI